MLKSLVERTQYVCGMAGFEPKDDPVGDDGKKKVFLVRSSTTCAHKVHVDYLRAKVNVHGKGNLPMFPPCCAHCGSEDERELLDAPADERVARGCRQRAFWPLCRGCHDAGKSFVEDKRKVTAVRTPGAAAASATSGSAGAAEATASATSGSAGASRERHEGDTAMDTVTDA